MLRKQINLLLLHVATTTTLVALSDYKLIQTIKDAIDLSFHVKIMTVLNLLGGGYYVQAINYDNFTIRLVDTGVHQDDCSSFPPFPLPYYEIDPYSNYKYQWSESEEYKWEELVYSSLYVDIPPCVLSRFNSSLSTRYSYVNIGGMNASVLKGLCSVEMVSLFPVSAKKNMSLIEIDRELVFGFQLSWHKHNINCEKSYNDGCYLDSRNRVRCMFGERPSTECFHPFSYHI